MTESTTPVTVTGTLETTVFGEASDPASQAVAPGSVTTEYERAVSGGWWGAVLMVAGVLVTGSSQIIEIITSLNADAGKVVGLVLALIGAVYRAAVDRAYIRGRADVKAATATGAAQVAVAEAKAGAAPVLP